MSLDRPLLYQPHLPLPREPGQPIERFMQLLFLAHELAGALSRLPSSCNAQLAQRPSASQDKAPPPGSIRDLCSRLGVSRLLEQRGL